MAFLSLWRKASFRYETRGALSAWLPSSMTNPAPSFRKQGDFPLVITEGLSFSLSLVTERFRQRRRTPDLSIPHFLLHFYRWRHVFLCFQNHVYLFSWNLMSPVLLFNLYIEVIKLYLWNAKLFHHIFVQNILTAIILFHSLLSLIVQHKIGQHFHQRFILGRG